MMITPILRRHTTFDAVVLHERFKLGDCGIALGAQTKQPRLIDSEPKDRTSTSMLPLVASQNKTQKRYHYD